MTATTEPAADAHQADPELPVPGTADDLTIACRLADYALAKLRHYLVGSAKDVSSHHIELVIRLGELYERLDAAQVRRQRAERPAPTAEGSTAKTAEAARHLAGEVQDSLTVPGDQATMQFPSDEFAAAEAATEQAAGATG